MQEKFNFGPHINLLMKTSWKLGELSSFDPFELKKMDFATRKPEISEMFTPEETELYIDGCDFKETCDYLLLAWEIIQRFGPLDNKIIFEAMAGPGRLGRELLELGTQKVIFHDGDSIMISHAETQAMKIKRPGQQINSITLPVDQLGLHLSHNSVDIVVCQNSIHQLSSFEKLAVTIENFLQITRPGGFVVIVDYRRDKDKSPIFLAALEERLFHTKPTIVKLLKPTFAAAFSKEEFEQVFKSLPGIKEWSITDASLPHLTPEMKTRVNQDPVIGHVLDRSPISLLAIVQKETA